MCKLAKGKKKWFYCPPNGLEWGEQQQPAFCKSCSRIGALREIRKPYQINFLTPCLVKNFCYTVGNQSSTIKIDTLLYTQTKSTILACFLFTNFSQCPHAKAAVATTVRFSVWFGSVWFALLALRCLCFWFRRWFAFALAWVPVPVPGPVSSKQSTDCPLCPVSTVHRPASGVPTSHRFVLVRFV